MIQQADNVRDIRFKTLPQGLLTRPTLLWQVGTDKPGKHLCEVSYLTGGMDWHAEYVMVVGADDATADFSGWVERSEQLRKKLQHARMKFIAGDVRHTQPVAVTTNNITGGGMAGSGERPGMQEKAFFEYHMYTLERPSTVAENESKQLEMFSPVAGIQVRKKYLYCPQTLRWNGQFNQDESYGTTSDTKVNVMVELDNSAANKLGIPLPAGTVRLYKRDPQDKALEFIGEQQIDHTPREEKVDLTVGNAFNVVGERKQTQFKVESDRKWMSESFEIKVRNHKSEAITVRVKEPLYRCLNWSITASSHKGQKLDAFTEIWDLSVPAQKEEGKPGEVTLTYTVEYTW